VKRNGQHIIKPKATLGQLKVADALRAEPAMPLPQKQSKIEVPIEQFKAEADLIVANRVTDDIKDMVDKVFTRDLFGNG
jgi:UDPglucose 6-dehydrogenase